MRVWGFRKPASPLGMDVDGEIVLSEILQTQTSYTCVDFAVISAKNVGGPDAPTTNASGHLNDTQAYFPELYHVVSDRGWRGRRVAISAPAEHVILRRMTFPTMPLPALRLAVKAEIERHMQLPIDDPIFDVYVLETNAATENGNPTNPTRTGTASQSEAEALADVLRTLRLFASKRKLNKRISFPRFRNRQSETSASEMDVMVAIAPRQEVMRWAELAERAGLRPVSVEPGLVAAARAIDFQRTIDSQLPKLIDNRRGIQGVAQNGGFSAVVILSKSGMDFGVLEGGDVMFMRHVGMNIANYLVSPSGMSAKPNQGANSNPLNSPDQASSDHSRQTRTAETPTGNIGLNATAYALEIAYEVDRTLSFAQYNVLQAGQNIENIWIVDKLNLGNAVVSALEERVEQNVSLARFRFHVADTVANGTMKVPHAVAVSIGLAMGVEL